METRKDYILERYVYFAPERKKRLKQFKKEEIIGDKVCFFCPGKEGTTPPEVGRIEENGKWIIRWFPNKFPVVNDNRFKKQKKKFLVKQPAFGSHEVIVETGDHKKQLWDLPRESIKKILDVYKSRIEELDKAKGIGYVEIFKNHGRQAGTSLLHSHTQVVALDRVPTLVQEEVTASKKFKKCPYCDIIKTESKSKRKCFENKGIIAIAPYASRFNYEVWVFPKRHVKNMTELTKEETIDLAQILKRILLKLKKANMDYNFFLHYAPRKTDLHFHIEVIPRIATWAGFEFSTGMTINSVTPEDAAEFYRK